MPRTRTATVYLVLFIASCVAACTSYSDETWIDPSIGRLPEAAARPSGDGHVEGD